ncbi:MAG: hypothetical protein ACD_58C00246G0002 [uncultured bacterium]|nr:MAG: hypothetical protein ACD_58C00246G0002 [uncultured bacterium]
MAKNVLEGKIKGYKNHPQLERFKAQDNPLDYINAYLLDIYDEARARGYRFSREKIGLLKNNLKDIKVSNGQIDYEFEHLLKKLVERDKTRYNELKGLIKIVPHRLFTVVEGYVESWEKIRKK